MPRLSLTIRWFFILVLLSLGLYFFFHLENKSIKLRRSQNLNEVINQVSSIKNTDPVILKKETSYNDSNQSNEKIPSAPSGGALNSESQFCKKWTRKFQWPEQYNEIIQTLNLQPTFENIHFKWNSGEERRVQKLINEKDQWEFRFFKLDSEGYPELLSSKDNKNPETRLEEWESSADTQVSQLTSEGQSAESNGQLRIEKINHQIIKLEYKSQTSTLLCSQSGCHCQNLY